MTKEEQQAKIVELTLAGEKPKPFGLFWALLLSDQYCPECQHTVSWAHIIYENNVGGEKYPNKVMRCKCGKMKRLWLHNRFYRHCVRCRKLPKPVDCETTKHMNGDEQPFRYKRFICECGLLQPHRNDGGSKPVVMSLD